MVKIIHPSPCDFEKHMAKGKLLATHFAGEVQWVEVKPGAALDSKRRVACELAKS